MADWIETYRGVVNAWECDVVEHFTIAYYFDRFADATRNFLDLIGEGESVGPSVHAAPSRLYVTFQHELRAGAPFHILSAVTGVEGGTLQLGHQVIDSASGKTVTWMAETLMLPAAASAAAGTRLGPLAIAWEGPKIPASAALTAPGFAAYRDRVRPWEIAESGALSLPGYVHRFSAACMQALTAIGMTAAYMKDQRRGFSTFELDLNIAAAAKVGDIIDVTTAVAHLGNSSLKFLHTMSCRKTGRPLASLGQAGVHLDMEARRSTPLPAELRELAAKLVVSAS